jgi:rubrerythrin
MLRIRARDDVSSVGRHLDSAFLAEALALDAPATPPEIIRIFVEPALELMRLLREAANIEHALLVQYLFAAFSIKDRYQDLVGGAFNSNSTIVGVAVQEMRHLADVNELLVALGAQPNLDREDFPIRTDVYPFELQLEPLTRSSVAKYVTAEAPYDALDPAKATTPEERRFREAVAAEVGVNRVNHIGSLYGTVIARLNEAITADPALLSDSASWVTRLEQIRGQGEHDHFLFFRSVFEGTHPAFGGIDVWKDANADVYPSRNLPKNPTAFEGADRTIPDPVARQIAWLANLHYWTVLGLLYSGHASTDTNLIGRAVSHMTSCLLPLGEGLASKNVGVPFDALALNFGPGTDRAATLAALRRLVGEVQHQETAVGANLPAGYSRSAAKLTLRALESPNV